MYPFSGKDSWCVSDPVLWKDLSTWIHFLSIKSKRNVWRPLVSLICQTTWAPENPGTANNQVGNLFYSVHSLPMMLEETQIRMYPKSRISVIWKHTEFKFSDSHVLSLPLFSETEGGDEQNNCLRKPHYPSPVWPSAASSISLNLSIMSWTPSQPLTYELHNLDYRLHKAQMYIDTLSLTAYQIPNIPAFSSSGRS